MLVIAILKINKMAAPGTLTFTGRHTAWGTQSCGVRGMASLAFSRGKVPRASYQLSGTVSSGCLTKTQLVQMWSSQDCDSQFVEQG